MGLMGGYPKLGFLGLGDTCVLAILPGQAQWIGSVIRASMARWIGWPGKEQDFMGGAKACIPEIR